MSEESLQALIETAKTARLQSVAPFSNFLVGAAVRTADGKVYTGCNVESASYGLTVCANASRSGRRCRKANDSLPSWPSSPTPKR